VVYCSLPRSYHSIRSYEETGETDRNIPAWNCYFLLKLPIILTFLRSQITVFDSLGHLHSHSRSNDSISRCVTFHPILRRFQQLWLLHPRMDPFGDFIARGDRRHRTADIQREWLRNLRFRFKRSINCTWRDITSDAKQPPTSSRRTI
jgi:hypothetical protein